MEKARILIVEDEAIIAMEIESSLQSLGYEITSIVNTGDDAIKKAEEDKPDLIIMDIRIKGEMDGIDAVEVIRNRFGIPVIFSTAYLDQERIERAKITMPFGYVLKPIQERDLRVTLEMALYVAKVDAERKLMEEELQEQKMFSENIINTAQVVILNLNTDGQIVSFNPYMEELSGYKLAEVAGLDWFETFLPSEDHSRIHELFKESVRDIKTRGNLNPIKIKSGELRQIEWYDTTLKDDMGNVLGVLAIGLDVTERQQAEKEILRSKILLESSIESPKDMIILSLDRHYRYIYFNKTHAESMATVFGTQPQIGDCIFDHMKGRDDIEKVKAHYDRSIAGEGHTAIEEYGEGELRFFYEIQYNPIFDDKKEIIGVTAFAQNITERMRAEEALKESEENYKNLIEYSPIAIQLSDFNGRTVDCNRELEALLGYTKEELSSTDLSTVYPEDRQIIQDAINKGLQENRRIRPYKIRLVNKRNEVIWVKVTSNVRMKKNEEGINTPVGFISFIEVITKKETVV